MIAGFLLGIIVTSSLVAGVIFVRFYRRTRDPLFLAFGAAFVIEGLNRVAFLMIDNPNEGRPLIYFVRLLAFSLIIAAIIGKNVGIRDSRH